MNRLSFLVVVFLLAVIAVPYPMIGNSRVIPARSTVATLPPSQGLVCFSQSSNSCPSQPAQFSAPLGSAFTAYIVIQSPQTFDGFRIWFKYPYGLLNATSVSLQGTVLPGATVTFECVNGVGSPSCGYWIGNGPGIVAVAASGNPTLAPFTGLLFAVTFKVTGNGGPESLGFFCTTNPSGPWLLDCASVSDGTNSLSVGVQDATFTTGPGPGSGVTIPIQETLSFDHVAATLSGSVTIDSSARLLTGTISVTVVNSTTGGVIFSKTFSFSFSFGTTTSVRFVLAIPIVPFTLGATCTVNTGTDQASCMLTRDPDAGGNGLVSANDASMVIAGYGQLRGSSGYDGRLDLDGDGMVDAVDASIVIVDYSAPVFY